MTEEHLGPKLEHLGPKLEHPDQ
jgi:hypothetical protein